MISDQYFVCANHYPPSGQLDFYSPTRGMVVSYSVSGTTWQFNDPITGQPGDFCVGKLSSALNPADGIATYPILELSAQNNYAAYTGLPLLTYGHDNGTGTGPRIGQDIIAGFATIDTSGDHIDDTFTVYHTCESLSPAGTAYYVGGDSSGPLFVPYNGSLARIGTHSAVGTDDDTPGVTYNFDNFIPAYLSEMTSQGISFTTVPEPAQAGVVFAFCAVAGFWLRRWRQRP